ncbi:MAG: hypothetical protein JWO19_3028 [Bryobacterales bacterium]|nr:hypothetical protein [Bryobacterales bacterium]
MTKWLVSATLALASVCFGADMARPKAGKVEILPLKEVKPGMQATAWTVFSGTEPEAMPVEVVGVWKNYLGPRQDVILCKLGGRGKETGVAAGMSGSPVYFDGKLMGAISLRMGVFSPDAVCGITPIESMLEIQDFDSSRPADARTPDKVVARLSDAPDVPSDMRANLPFIQQIETPMMFSGFSAGVLKQFEPVFSQMGVTAVQGGSTASHLTAKPAPGWEKSLNPGEAVSGILVSGDMSATGMGTVTYNDGKRVLAFGHPFYNLGPIDMPMAKSDIMMVFSSSYQPTKFGSATEVVGALKQDRYTGIMGELGAEAPTVPVHVRVRSLGAGGAVLGQKDLNFNVFVHQKWTPLLMNMTLANSLQQMNEFADEITYRISGDVQLAGSERLHVSTVQAGSDAMSPLPLTLGAWWGDKFTRLFQNNVTTPNLKQVECVVDLLPDRRIMSVDTAWTPSAEVTAGTEIPVKVFLRPYRGERIEQNVTVKIPADLPKGEHRILLSDAVTLNRLQSAAVSSNRYLDLPETVSLLNQERGNNRLYVSVVQRRPTYYSEDKTLPALPLSVLNVLQSQRSAGRALTGIAESAEEELSIPFDQMVTGSFSLPIVVR